jgi:Icc-related predicted phosphoesterase
MSDFRLIKDFDPWVYQQNAQSVKYLHTYVEPGDVVVTHHLPSLKSVHARYKSSGLNRFFVCEMDELIAERKPKLWLHGHTHNPCEHMLGDTRVVCNPHGYMGEKMTAYNEKLVLEV